MLNATMKARVFLTQLRFAHVSATKNLDSPGILKYPATEVKKLPNGLRIACENWNSELCSVGIFLDVGSRFDPDHIPGAAHFWQNIAFKGTANRSQVDIENQAIERGAVLRSHTTRELNSLTVQCRHQDVTWAIELLADIVKNNKFNPSVVSDASKSILKLMEEEEHNFEQVVYDYLYATAYQGTSLGRPVVGQMDTIKNMKPDHVTEFVKSHFKGPRIVLAVAGGLNPSEVFDAADKHLSDVSCNYDESAIPVRHPIRFTGSELKDRDDAYPLAHIAFAVEGPGWAHPDSMPLRVAAAINGSWERIDAGAPHLAGKLANAFAEVGVIHSFDSFFHCYHNTSLWGIYCTSERISQDHETKRMLKEWVRISNQATEFEVERAKSQLITTLLSNNAQGGTNYVCNEIGHQMLAYDKRIPLEEAIQRIKNVSVKHVRNVGHKYIYDNFLAVSAFGPIEALEHYDRLRNHLFNLTN